ncbi:hypothetical protein [Microbacterium timonense]|uniref:hypothetical protein n=1 Tax=Microbacterium timonense TaxID=2086576 RepID=UPI0011B27551|nr:hypothetical protein [Microbacterium timonense]
MLPSRGDSGVPQDYQRIPSTLENPPAHVDEIEVDASQDHIDVVSSTDDIGRKALLVIRWRPVGTASIGNATELKLAGAWQEPMSGQRPYWEAH